MKINREMRQPRERKSPHVKLDSVNSLDRKLANALKAALRKNKAGLANSAYTTIGADWMLEHSKPEMSLPVVERFLSRQPRPEYLLPWNEALATAIKKDKRGDLLAAILRQPSRNEDQVQALSEVVRSNKALFKNVADLLPTILTRKDSTATTVRFVHWLFDGVIISEDHEREFFTVVLARLAAGILLADRRNPSSDVLKVTEPRANVLGLFSEGRNVVGRNGKGELLPNYGRIFGQQNVYIQAARGFVLHGGHGNLVTIMVVDIGAFTTDIASLTFDVSDMSDGLSAIRQESYALGVINELDKPLFAALEERHDVSFSNLSFRDCEYLKRSLYNGTPYFLLTRSNGKDVKVELGDNKDMQLVESITGKFAEAVLKKVGPFVDEQRPERVFLTGGGSLIQPIAATLKAAFSRRRIPVQDVQQDSVAFGAEVWRPWKDTGEGLQRLATSLGGANVIPQESASTICDGENVARRRAPIVTEPPAGYRTCRCQGGNKDCCFCGGRGFLP